MPTQGSYIPVLTTEKLWLDKDGRGLYAHDDGVACKAGTWTNIEAYSSGTAHVEVLPAPSTTAWIKVTVMSGTTGTTFHGYIPVFSGNILGF